MKVRKYNKGEEKQLFEIFSTSVQQNAKGYYNEQQLNAWAPEEIDEEQWMKRMSGIKPYVVVENDLILGYADLQKDGYIDHFFIRGGYSGKGIGKFLMNYIIEIAMHKGIKELTADVSLAAQGFFSRFGFEVVERKSVVIRGVELENARMKLDVWRAV